MRFVGVALMALWLTACGQTGPLYLPESVDDPALNDELDYALVETE